MLVLELVIGDTLILIDGKSTRFAEIWEEYSLNVVVGRWVYFRSQT